MTIFVHTDRSGTIGFNEFAGLWKYIKTGRNVFKHFRPRPPSGSIDGNELRDALAQFGTTLPAHLLVLVQRKYDVKASATAPAPGRGAPPASHSIASSRACVVVKQLSEAFGRLDTDREWVDPDWV
ncbi:hypothetical protein C8F04DRAFT_1408221 [Mycena alexandri]|uniref:EF-hand domain-containing protein n=1 Tax=Mycena alexandri TaxID=1745969 RepID=A0AAD6RVH3_9AGAR|nr:hypothetical protein C8F04DRAFT_1408221 [Mycena alexandri]